MTAPTGLELQFGGGKYLRGVRVFCGSKSGANAARAAATRALARANVKRPTAVSTMPLSSRS